MKIPQLEMYIFYVAAQKFTLIDCGAHPHLGRCEQPHLLYGRTAPNNVTWAQTATVISRYDYGSYSSSNIHDAVA